MKERKAHVNLTIDPKVWDIVKRQASEENRTASNLVETVLKQALKRAEQ